MRFNSTHNNRIYSRIPTFLPCSLILLAALGIGGISSQSWGTVQRDKQLSFQGTITSQPSDLVLLYIFESMIQLLEEIENIQDTQDILPESGELEEVSIMLAWGYSTLGLSDELTAIEVLEGHDMSGQAIITLQDETQVLPIPDSLRDCLLIIVEEMHDDFVQQL